MPTNRYRSSLLTFLLLSTVSTTTTLAVDCTNSNEQSYFDNKAKGWFWGEGCDKKKKVENKDKNDTAPKKEDEPKKENNETKEENIPKPKYKVSPKEVNIPWDIIDTLSRESVKKIEKEARDIAVTYPTFENVLEHKKLQKHISDGAKAFMNQTINVTKQDFDMAQWVSSMPVRSATAINTNQASNKDKRMKIFSKYKNNMIIMTVTKKGCDYCEKQKPLLKMFEDEYGVQHEIFDMAKFKDFAYAMKVERTPDMFLLFRETENDKNPKIVRIATGLHGVLDLADATIFGLKALKKISDKEVE